MNNETSIKIIHVYNQINSTQLIIIASVSGVLILLFCYIIYIMNDKRKREEDFRKWLSKEANARIPNLQSQYYKV